MVASTKQDVCFGLFVSSHLQTHDKDLAVGRSCFCRYVTFIRAASSCCEKEENHFSYCTTNTRDCSQLCFFLKPDWLAQLLLFYSYAVLLDEKWYVQCRTKGEQYQKLRFCIQTIQRYVHACLAIKQTNQLPFLVVRTRKQLQVVQILYFILWREHNCCDSLQTSM